MTPRFGEAPEASRRYIYRPGVYALLPRDGALLLTHYQMELASRGLGGLAEFLGAGPRRVEIPGSPRRYRVAPPSQELLWDGRPPEAVQRGLIKFWKAKGLSLEFQPTRPLPPGGD